MFQRIDVVVYHMVKVRRVVERMLIVRRNRMTVLL